MFVLFRINWCKRVLSFVFILCLMLPSAAMADHLKADDPRVGVADCDFSVLILGDSQMAGEDWDGGYANCIAEEYPNAKVLNLAKGGSLLANGEIYAQWALYLSEGLPMPDFVLLDGGINDLPELRKQGYASEELTKVTDALSLLIEQIHEASPDTHIIYLTMPPVNEWKDSEQGPPPYDIQQIYWKRMSITANKYDGVTVLDLFSLNPFRFPCVECYHEYLADSIHLGEAGYRKTFEYIDNVLVAQLVRKLEGQ